MAVLEVVQSGAQLLDERRPGWYREIDIAQLDIALGSKCILGQVYGSYFEGVKAIGLACGQTAPYGFAVTFSGPAPDNYANLTAAWREEIALRRLAEMPIPQVEPVAAIADDCGYC